MADRLIDGGLIYWWYWNQVRSNMWWLDGVWLRWTLMKWSWPWRESSRISQGYPCYPGVIPRLLINLSCPESMRALLAGATYLEDRPSLGASRTDLGADLFPRQCHPCSTLLPHPKHPFQSKPYYTAIHHCWSPSSSSVLSFRPHQVLII